MIGNVNLIREEGLKVLYKGLGAAKTAIFIRQFESGSGSYTEDREELLKDAKLDDIISRIKKREENEGE